jgi:hypothetical protein
VVVLWVLPPPAEARCRHLHLQGDGKVIFTGKTRRTLPTFACLRTFAVGLEPGRYGMFDSLADR